MRKTVPIVLSTILAASILGTPVVTSAQTQDVKAETAQNVLMFTKKWSE